MRFKDRPPLIQYWHDENIPDDIEELFALVREHNPEMRHLVFNEQTATTLIETHLTAREVAAFEACAVPAMQADYFRYCAVYALGGVYCDADSRCSGSLMRLLDVDGTLFENTRAPGIINNHIFGFRAARHPMLKLAIEIATAGIETRFAEIVAAVTGPYVLSLLWQGFQRGSVDVWLEELIEGLDGNPNPRVDRERLSRQLEAIRGVAGDHSDLVRAFDGVRVAPLTEASMIVTTGGSGLAYKKTTNHFPNWEGSIYR